jgi:hypothetical protein
MSVVRADVGTSALSSVLAAVRCCGQLEPHRLVPKYNIYTIHGENQNVGTNRGRPVKFLLFEGTGCTSYTIRQSTIALSIHQL